MNVQLRTEHQVRDNIATFHSKEWEEIMVAIDAVQREWECGYFQRIDEGAKNIIIGSLYSYKRIGMECCELLKKNNFERIYQKFNI